LVTEVHV